MIIYLLVGFWVGFYGIDTNENFLKCMCIISIFETTYEIFIIIFFWDRIKDCFKNLFKK